MKIPLLIVNLIGSAIVFAAPAVQPPIELAGPIQVYTEQVPTPFSVLNQLDNLSFAPSSPRHGDGDVSLAEIENYAERAWAVVERNQPILNVQYQYANALPKGVTGAEELEGFSNMQHHSYRSYGKNLFGMTVFDVVYTLVFRYGGSYRGQGQYLEGVTVLPSRVEALWGYRVNLAVEKISVLNVGTEARPVAALTMGLDLKVGTIIKKAEYHTIFDFRGDSNQVGRSTR